MAEYTKAFKFCSSFDELVDQLSKGNDNVFGTMYHLFLFAAMVGFSSGKRRKPQSTGKIVEDHLFKNNIEGFSGLLLGLAVNEEKDKKVLGDDEESKDLRFKIFEEYANEGLHVIKTEVMSKKGDIRENFLSYLSSVASREKHDAGVKQKSFKFIFGE